MTTGKYNEYSDRDFNDVVMVVDIGEANVKDLTGIPEPGTVLALAGVGIAGVFGLRRRQLA